MHVPLIGGVIFIGLVLLTVGGSAWVAFARNIVHAAFALLAAFFGVAGLFLFLSADFVGIIQLLVYVGGVLVLFLFAVMLTSRIDRLELSNLSHGVVPGVLVFLGTVGVLGVVALRTDWGVLGVLDTGPTTDSIGDALLTTYVLPFEIASLLLVAALIGAVLLASRRMSVRQEVLGERGDLSAQKEVDPDRPSSPEPSSEQTVPGSIQAKQPSDGEDTREPSEDMPKPVEKSPEPVGESPEPIEKTAQPTKETEEPFEERPESSEETPGPAEDPDSRGGES